MIGPHTSGRWPGSAVVDVVGALLTVVSGSAGTEAEGFEPPQAHGNGPIHEALGRGVRAPAGAEARRAEDDGTHAAPPAAARHQRDPSP